MTEIVTRKLEELEAVIERGLETFIEVGQALKEIRDNRLYKEIGYTRFEDYCRERWSFERSYAYYLIQSAGVAAEMSTIVDDPPTTEFHARELAKVKDVEKRKAVWEAVQKDPEPVTARKIREEAKRQEQAEVAEYVEGVSQMFTEEAREANPRLAASHLDILKAFRKEHAESLKLIQPDDFSPEAKRFLLRRYDQILEQIEEAKEVFHV